MDLLQLVFSFVNAPLFATFFLGMFWKRATGHGGFWGLIAGNLAAKITHGLTVAEGKGGWIANLHEYYSGTSQAFNIAAISFIVCFMVTMIVSLAMKSGEYSLVGLVSSLMPNTKYPNKVWYKAPLTLGLVVRR